MPVDTLRVEILSETEDRWAVVNDFGAEIFAGTKEQVEDWFDHNQNLERLATERRQ